MGWALRERPCGSGLVGEALWERPCGKGLVGKALWERPCGRDQTNVGYDFKSTICLFFVVYLLMD